jgi:hypothetical protein
LGSERKQAFCSILTPKTCQQIREFLRAASFCRIWIPKYSLLAKTLYEASTRVGVEGRMGTHDMGRRARKGL